MTGIWQINMAHAHEIIAIMGIWAVLFPNAVSDFVYVTLEYVYGA
jgi:hypothetical protein